ncbi:zinc finger, CCHC-type containing protein [Tanacetum coccineum]
MVTIVPPQILIISNPEPCYNQNLNEIVQNLQSLQQQCLLGTCQQCGCNEYDGVCFYCTVGNGTPINFSTPSFANHPPQPQYVPYSCEFCGNDARYGHYCTPQVPFIYPEPCYNQDFNFPQDFHDFQQQYLCCENCGGPHETFQCQPMNEDYYHEQNSCYDSNSFGFDQTQPPQYTVNHPIFNAQNELLNSQNKLMEQMTSICDMVGQYMQKKEEEKKIAEDQAAKDRYWNIPICYDDDEDYTITITPVLSTEELISTLSDDDSPYGEDIDYVDASPPDAEIVSLEVVEIVIPEVGGIDDDILLTIKDDILREKLLNVNLLIANIEALKDNPTPSSDFVTKSSSTSLNLFLEETNTFDNSLTESETFCFDLEENSSGSTTTLSDYSLPDYEAFYLDDDHIEEKSSGSTTTHADFSQYDSFIFDLSIDSFPPADRSDFYHEEFADELAHIISPPEYDCFYFKSEPDPGELTSIVDSGIRENVLPTTNVNLPFEDAQSPLLAYVVWIFLAFLTYPVTPPYLLSCENEDTIFDPGISVYHSFMPGTLSIFKIKLKVDGTTEKFKARLVIQGFRQKSGINYFDTYAPIAHISTIRLLIAMTSIHNLIIYQIDVKTAFLNGELDEEVYMNQTQGFIMPGNEKNVCKLIKSLYGLKQAPKQWHQKFDEVVLSNDYLLNQADKYVYNKFDESGKGVIICLYVDDMLIFGTDQVQVDLTKEFLSSRFSMKDMGEANVILVIRIKHESNGISISQSHYIEKILKKFNYFDCTPVSTPMYTSEKLMPNNGQAVSQLEYSKMIGCLIRKFVYQWLGIPAWWWCNFLGFQETNLHHWFNNESEFVALAAASKEAEWLKNLLLEIPLWSKPIAPISIRYDSAATLAKDYSQMYNGKSRHLGVRHSMIRELITNGVVSIEFVRS